MGIVLWSTIYWLNKRRCHAVLVSFGCSDSLARLLLSRFYRRLPRSFLRRRGAKHFVGTHDLFCTEAKEIYLE